MTDVQQPSAVAGYAPTFDALAQHACPDWFRDAKFGIWSHWGPQSVPMYGDWYARHMYTEGHPQYLYHLRHYGHPSAFGYKDICALWKAERFDPAGLMRLYKRAGARYFVAQATHHDHFFNYASKVNRFNSVDVGPGKDICALWKAAAESEGLPFGLTEHLGAAFSWWKANKSCDSNGPHAGVPYDGNDPAYRDFYFDNREHLEANPDKSDHRPWYTTNPGFHAYWLSAVKEMIDLFEPDLFYSDGGIPFGNKDQEHPSTPGDPLYRPGLEAVAHLYNTSARKHGENRAVYNHKDGRPDIARVGVLDLERSQLPGIHPTPWQTDTCIGVWFYDVRQPYKKPAHLIEMLIDIVAKNGCMLLNILQRPDGALDDEATWLLEEMAGWFAVCGEAVHGTRPWRTYGEGEHRVIIKGFTEDPVSWSAADLRFTCRDRTLYAFLMHTPDNRVAVLRSLTEADRVTGVRLLGAGECPFQQAFGALTVQLPDTLPTAYTNCLAIQFA